MTPGSILPRVRKPARLAAALWLVLAFVVWNVIFDRILVLAGRRYSYEAAVSARAGRGYLLINDWMRPAVAHGAVVATFVAAVIAIVGLTAVSLASRLDRGRQGS
jgi:hypothetical protein